MNRKTLALTCGLATAWAAPALAADRAETTRVANLVMLEKCPLTAPLPQDKGPKESGLEIALLGAFANIVGDLAGSGVQALAGAIDEASREQGFVSQATTSYNFFQVEPSVPNPSDAAKPRVPVKLIQPRQCAVLFVDGPGSVDELLAPALRGELQARLVSPSGTSRFLNERAGGPTEGDNERAVAVVEEMKAAGVVGLPLLYIEAAVIPDPDGMIIKPNFVWYRLAQEKSAPKGPATAELHFTFATPAFGDKATALGTAFNTGRISLPKIKPGQMLGPMELRAYSSSVVPRRGTTGNADDLFKAFQGVEAAIVTAKAKARGDVRLREAAQRKWENDKKFENKEAVTSAQLAEDDSKEALKAAEAFRTDLKATRAGATNVEMRFVVIRDANKFGQALAKALGAQKDNVDKAVTDALTPSADNSAADVTYLQALADVRAKEREIDQATADGKTSSLAALNDQLVVLKAKANEKAVAAGHAKPFPGLLAQIN